MKVREVRCKSILSRSGLADYCLNCYIGCEHGCRYCYARFMKRYTNHQERWGEFVDVKINAVEVLNKEAETRKKGEVFVSSVCDGWQPLEAKYKLTHQCLKILLEKGFSLTVLTKSALIETDLPILKRYGDRVEVGLTLTMLDERLKDIFEPFASYPSERISILRKAADLGIKTYAFLGPLLPHLSDREKDIERLFGSLRHIPLEDIYIDRLNPRSGVWESIYPILKRHYSHLVPRYKILLFDRKTSQLYSLSLAKRAKKIAEKYGMEKKLRLCF